MQSIINKILIKHWQYLILLFLILLLLLNIYLKKYKCKYLNNNIN